MQYINMTPIRCFLSVADYIRAVPDRDAEMITQDLAMMKKSRTMRNPFTKAMAEVAKARLGLLIAEAGRSQHE